jgi:hypothetical protein
MWEEGKRINGIRGDGKWKIEEFTTEEAERATEDAERTGRAVASLGRKNPPKKPRGDTLKFNGLWS